METTQCRINVGLHSRALKGARRVNPHAYRRALGEAVFVSAVEEIATYTLDTSLSLNTHTDYKMSDGKHDVVTEQLLSRCR